VRIQCVEGKMDILEYAKMVARFVVDAIAKVCQYCCGFGYNFGSTNIAHILICILVVYMVHLR
jgi:hypothetical protein